MILKEIDFQVLILADFLMFCRIGNVALAACRLVRHDNLLKSGNLLPIS